MNRMIVCGNTSTLFFVYISLTYVFKLIIQIVGLILAFLTRKVKIDPLNDSRYSAILIYISFGLLIVSFIIVFLVEDNNTYAGVWTTFVLAEVCVFLGLNFIPKVKLINIHCQCIYRVVGNFGEVFSLTNWQFCGKFKIRQYYFMHYRSMWRRLQSPNLESTNAF